MISKDDWLKALADVGVPCEDDRDAITTNEFAAAMGLTRSAAQRRLQMLVEAGRASRTMKWVNGSDGRRQHHVAFKLVDGKKKR